MTLAQKNRPSAWLRAEGHKAARVARRMGFDVDDPTAPVVMAPLGGPSRPGSREDRCCDRCGRYVPVGELLWLFTYGAAPRLVLTGGLCAEHARVEGVEVVDA